MPITTREEARKALECDRPFLVDERYILPSQIVSMKGGDEPKFFLADGTVVQHQQYSPNETGDLLYAAFQQVERPEGQADQIDPSYFAWNGEDYVGVSGVDWGDSGLSSDNANGFHVYQDALIVLEQDGNGYHHFRKYPLGTAWDIDTAQARTQSFELSSFGGSSNLEQLFGTPDGEYLYLTDGTNVIKYALSSPRDLTTASKVGAIGWPDRYGNDTDAGFNPDGTVAWAFDGALKRYELSTPYDLESASQTDAFSLTNYDGQVVGAGESARGNPVVLLQDDGEKYKYDIGELEGGDPGNFNPPDSTFDGDAYFQSSEVTGSSIPNSGRDTSMQVVGDQGGRIYIYRSPYLAYYENPEVL